MRTARFFVPPEWIALSAEAFAIPAGATYQQIRNVLRMEVGDTLGLCMNDGTEVDGRITEITPSAIFGVIAGSKVNKPLNPEVTVCFSLLKNDHSELVLQKCTELGITAFLPIISDRTIKKTKEIPPRWHNIIKEAAEQSGRTTLPTIQEPLKFSQALEKTDGMRRIVLHEAGGLAMPKIAHTDRVALFIGPEGGFTENEIAAAMDATSHIVHLGDELVLRAETAAIVGTTLIRLQ